MTDLPPPYGRPRGPSLARPELLAAFLSGADAGSAPDAHIEGAVLMSGHQPVAMRIVRAVLVRSAEMTEDADAVRAALCATLRQAGADLVEQDAPLANLVEIELVGRRADPWDLWAQDAQEGRAELARRALGDMPDAVGILEEDKARRQAQSEIDAALSEIEREL
ncbi:MAG TPA: hypothetical protein VM324_16855 [Egibacteraceae bacterium]|nr:hypothetical protein [Egibacteraceae bacterium]